MIEGWIKQQKKESEFGAATAEKEWEPEETLIKDEGPASLSIVDAKIKNIIWATGYHPDFSWIKIDGIVENFNKRTNLPEDVHTKVPGFFFLEFPWLGPQRIR
jgi:hypothetical protein